MRNVDRSSLNRRPRRAIAVSGLSVLIVLSHIAADPAPSMSYLDNDVVRLGVDLDMGGVITYLSRSADAINVINSFDFGREIAPSYYSGPTPFGNPQPPWSGTQWNPVGAGDSYGNRSQVTASRNDGSTLYVRTIPLQWALNNVPCECYFESWFTLDGSAVNVRYRLTNHREDLTQYGAHGANEGGGEFPAVYTIGKLYRIFTYDGLSPFTGAPIRQISFQPGSPWGSYRPTENWLALVDDSGWGLGVLNTEVYTFLAGFAGTPGVGGTSDDSTGYIAPVREEILDHNITYDYDVSLILGTLPEIRAYAVAHRRKEPRPDFHFALDEFQEDRQHFSYQNAQDTGLPLKGGLHVKLDRPGSSIYLPESLWDAASAPVIYMNAAFHTHESSPSPLIAWSVPGEDFADSRVVSFPVVPDGEFHTYAINLQASPAYTGAITRLRLDPGGGFPGDYLVISSISFRRDDAARHPRVVVRSP